MAIFQLSMNSIAQKWAETYPKDKKTQFEEKLASTKHCMAAGRRTHAAAHARVYAAPASLITYQLTSRTWRWPTVSSWSGGEQATCRVRRATLIEIKRAEQTRLAVSLTGTDPSRFKTPGLDVVANLQSLQMNRNAQHLLCVLLNCWYIITTRGEIF
jgi:hypothetical protein